MSAWYEDLNGIETGREGSARHFRAFASDCGESGKVPLTKYEVGT